MALEAVQAQAGHASIESTRVYLHLANDWLADQYLRAAELIDADTAAVAEMLAVQEAAARRARYLPGSGHRRAGHAEAEWALIRGGRAPGGCGDVPLPAAAGRVLGAPQRGGGRQRAAPVGPLDDHPGTPGRGQ